MATNTLRADSACVTPAPQLPALAELKINGVSPFWSHGDGMVERVAEAHAILTMLADRHDMAEDNRRLEAECDIRHEIQSRALAGVQTLLALAVYHSDCVDARRAAEAK